VALSVVTAAVLASLCLVVLPSAARASGCPNEERRAEQGALAEALPDCRAYELVSPGSNPQLGGGGETEYDRAAVTGEKIAYYSSYPTEEATRSGYNYLATRGADGWSTEEVAPQNSPSAAKQFRCEQFVYFSADLSRGVLGDGWNIKEEIPGESYCQSSEEQLAAGAPAGYGNLFYREGESGPYSLVNVTPQTAVPANALLQDTSEDLSHILFSEKAKLTGIGTSEEAPVGYNLYEWAGGSVRLVAFLPDGEPVAGNLADGAAHSETDSVYGGEFYALAPVTHALSADGESVFFYAEHEGGVSLYVRLHAMQPSSGVYASGPNAGKVNGEQCTEPGMACTVEVDRVQGGAGTSGDGVFWDASEDGSRVFFADERKLTPGAGATTGKPDLYEYNVSTGVLTDLTPEALAGKANARGFSGASPDGAYLYFVATGTLTGSQENSQGNVAVPREPNLYLDHEGALTFIATLRGEAGYGPHEQDFEDWQENEVSRNEVNDGTLNARVSPDGEYLAFTSVNSLTGYENAPAESQDCQIQPDDQQPCKEIFLYDAADNQLACVSCDPGVRPTGNTTLPGPTKFSEKTGSPAYMSRNVLDDGRVFFTSPDVLVPRDTNGLDDVYEYEDGQVQLISSGESSGDSVFYDASPSGRDVFFVTAQSLVAADTEGGDSLYDAREGGGFAGEGIKVNPPECEPEDCRLPIGEPPVKQAAASLTEAGPGNPLAPPPPNGGGEPKTGARKLTRAQQLATALRACRKQSGKKRKACEAKARKRFAAKPKTKKAKSGKKGGGR
jgi:hypothetical protein